MLSAPMEPRYSVRPGARSISPLAGRALTCRDRDPSPGHSARACL